MQQNSAQLEQNVQEAMKQNSTTLMQRFNQNLQIIQDQTVQAEQQSEAILKGKVNEMLLDFEQRLSAFLASSEQKSLDAINLEVKSARELIETYKKQQLSLVDENIIAVLERTLALVLRRHLKLDEQMDLVFESLEKAKEEKFFV